MPPLMETGNEIAQMVSRLEAAITAVEKRASVAESGPAGGHVSTNFCPDYGWSVGFVPSLLRVR